MHDSGLHFSSRSEYTVPAAALTSGTRYTWQVLARNDSADTGSWTEPEPFVTGEEACCSVIQPHFFYCLRSFSALTYLRLVIIIPASAPAKLGVLKLSWSVSSPFFLFPIILHSAQCHCFTCCADLERKCNGRLCAAAPRRACVSAAATR